MGKKLVLLYVQPQHQDVNLSTPACLDKFAVGTHPLTSGTLAAALFCCLTDVALYIWQFGACHLGGVLSVMQ